MNKIRTAFQLNEFLNNELAWRKRELTTVRFMIDKGREHQRKALLRSAICTLYAHWEAFVKAAATAYICLVAMQGLKYRELAPSFIALGIKGRIHAAGIARKLRLATELTTYVLTGLEERAVLPWDRAVDTESNLSSDVFMDILHTLGIDEKPYLTKAPLIDRSLLDNRHQVAHGQYLDIEEGDYQHLYTEILQLIERFRTDIENAAITQSYRLATSSPI